VLEAATGVEALRVVEGAAAIDLNRLRRHHAGDGRADHATELRRRGLNVKIIFVSGYATTLRPQLPEGQEFLSCPSLSRSSS